jgi:hypothetical protein
MGVNNAQVYFKRASNYSSGNSDHEHDQQTVRNSNNKLKDRVALRYTVGGKRMVRFQTADALMALTRLQAHA